MRALLLLLAVFSLPAYAVDTCVYNLGVHGGVTQTSETLGPAQCNLVCGGGEDTEGPPTDVYNCNMESITPGGTHDCGGGLTLPRYTWGCRMMWSAYWQAQSNFIVKGCPGDQVWNGVSESCVDPPPPPCQSGTQFLGRGQSTSPQCLNGCAYGLGSESRYTEDGVLSRWVATGTTCSGGNTLTAADNSGCPNETPVDWKSILCGIPPPCETGKFLFQGQCVADTTEAGCVIIEGEQICAEADQNCVVVDGKRICVEAPKPEDMEMYKDNGCVWSLAQAAWVCPSETGKKTETSTTTSVTDPETGQVTKTKVTTTKDNVLPGVQTTTTTTVFDSDGNELSSETVTKTEGGGGQMSALVARAASALGEKEDLDWLRTYEEVRESLSDQWEGLEVVQAVKSFQNLSLTAVEGVCPEFCLPLWGETLCTTAHCEIWAQISFVIQGVLLALYGMAAIRIVLSA